MHLKSIILSILLLVSFGFSNSDSTTNDFYNDGCYFLEY